MSNHALIMREGWECLEVKRQFFEKPFLALLRKKTNQFQSAGFTRRHDHGKASGGWQRQQRRGRVVGGGRSCISIKRTAARKDITLHASQVAGLAQRQSA